MPGCLLRNRSPCVSPRSGENFTLFQNLTSCGPYEELAWPLSLSRPFYSFAAKLSSFHYAVPLMKCCQASRKQFAQMMRKNSQENVGEN